MHRVTELLTDIVPDEPPAPIGIQLTGVPERPDPVLAVIEQVSSLGVFQWREVIVHNGEQWTSFRGSKTFEDGEKVLRWVYAKEVI